MNATHRLTSLGFLALGFSFLRSHDALAREWPEPPADAPPRAEPADRDGPPADKTQPQRKHEHFRLGVLGGVGFPRPLAVEGIVKLERTMALGAEYSVVPTFTISGAETRIWAIAADVRFFPFQNAFFVGIRAGRQHLEASGSFAVNGYGVRSESLAVDTTFVNPRIGFLWTYPPGFSIGIDAGAQIPLTTGSSNSLPPGTVANAGVARFANAYGERALPTLDLLRIGLLL